MAGYEMGEVEERFPDALVIGVDEVGIGPLAGPVTAGAVALDLLLPTVGIDDSKRLSEPKRERMRERIMRDAIAYGVASVSHKDIDRLGMARASNRARRNALVAVLEELDLMEGSVEIVVAVDGENEITGHPRLRGVRQFTYIKGDRRSWNVAAASILAKQDRDTWMSTVAHRRWPVYGFKSHKGYPTQRHTQALLTHGPCEIHRRSFGMIKDLEG